MKRISFMTKTNQLPPEVRMKVAEECHPPEHFWQWEIRADEPYEVWKRSGVHRKVWSPKHYAVHRAALTRTAARLIQVNFAAHFDKMPAFVAAVATDDVNALERLVAELSGWV
jgi:hypothetical protein